MDNRIKFIMFVVSRSFLDYFVCMFGIPVVNGFFFYREMWWWHNNWWVFYAQFLLWSGLLLFVAMKQWKPEYLIYSGIAVFLCENFFYIWINLFGNINGCYDWYTGNPLNPDGMWGYGWTNPMNMLTFFGHVMTYYTLVMVLFVVSKWVYVKFKEKSINTV